MNKCFCPELSQNYIWTQLEICVLTNLPIWLFRDKNQTKILKGRQALLDSKHNLPKLNSTQGSNALPLKDAALV